MDDKKRIAFVISKLSSGGAQRVIATLANELVAKLDVIIITYTNRASFYELNPKVKHISCFDEESIRSSTNFFESILLNYKLNKRIGQIVKNEQVDLVIGFITQSNIFSIFAAKRNGIPSIISERSNPKRSNTPKFWKILRNLAYPRTDCLVVQTENVKKYYAEKVPVAKIVTLPNPINPTLSAKRTDNQKENIILCVGRLHKLKNHAMAIKAFENIKPEGWRLILLGEGPEEENLQKLISGNTNIELAGAITNIEDYYNRARIFLFTSNHEGFPNALLEAMHFGLAPISTDCESGPSEIIEDGNNGYLVPVGNVMAMEQKLKMLTENEELLEKLAAQAQLTTKRYLSENVTRSWYNLINSKLN